jgi:type I restriction enzyme, S subunit
MTSAAVITIDDLCQDGIVELQTGPFGSQLHAHDYVAAGVPVVPTEAIRNRKVAHEGLPQISEAKAIELSRHRLLDGDILFARRGVQATGQSAIVREQEVGFICGTGAIRLRLKKTNGRLLPRYLSHLLMAPPSIEWIRHNAIGATMPNLNEGIIRRFSFAIPSLNEQTAVADLLDALDDKIELNRRMNETLEAMARAIFKDWFVDFGPTRAKIALSAVSAKNQESRKPYLAPDLWSLFPDKLDADGKPEGWEMGSLTDIAEVLMGASPSGDTYNDHGIGTPLVNGPVEYGDYFLRRIKWTTAPSRLSQRGDLIVCVRGSTTGRYAFADGEYCLGRGVAAVRARGNRQEFVELSVLVQMDRLLQRTTGSVFPNLGSDDFREFATLVPSDLIQDAFSVMVRPLRERVWANVNEASTLAALRDLLLPKLMSGEIRVKDAEIMLGTLT